MRCYICDYASGVDQSLFHSGLPIPSSGQVKLLDGKPVCASCHEAKFDTTPAAGELPVLDGEWNLGLE